MAQQAIILRALGGTPDSIVSDLKEFEASTQALSDNHPRFIDEHPQKWVAVYRGNVAVAADTFDQVVKQIEEKRLPREHVIVRFITRDKKTLIL
jgi:hypothetical protein